MSFFGSHYFGTGGASSGTTVTAAADATNAQTLKGIRDQVLYWLDEAGDTGTTKTNVDAAINQAHQLRLSGRPWSFMIWDTPETFTTSSGTHFYSLHQEFARPIYFYNRTKKKYLVETPMRNLGPSGARWNDDQARERFTLWGRTSVQAQPSSSSVITIVSSSASDTGSGNAITIRGVTSNGVATESIVPTGTTPKSSTNSFSKILKVTKAAAWTGTLTMTSNSGAVTNLKLLAGELGRSYQQIFFLFDPASSDTIEYRFYRLPSALVNDNDIPDLPAAFNQILVWDTLLLLAAYNDELNPARVQVWGKMQKEWEISLEAGLDEGQSINAEPTYARYEDTDLDFFPQINR